MRRMILGLLVLLAGCDGAGPGSSVRVTLDAPTEMRPVLSPGIFGSTEHTCTVPFTATAEGKGYISWINATLTANNLADGRGLTPIEYPLQVIVDAFGTSRLTAGESASSSVAKTAYDDFVLHLTLRFQQEDGEIQTASFTTVCRK